MATAYDSGAGEISTSGPLQAAGTVYETTTIDLNFLRDYETIHPQLKLSPKMYQLVWFCLSEGLECQILCKILTIHS